MTSDGPTPRDPRSAPHWQLVSAPLTAGDGTAPVPVSPADGDPVIALLAALLGPDGADRRWALAIGRAAATPAGDLLAVAADDRVNLIVVTGDPRTDRLLAGIAPVLADLLADLTERQRLVARLLLVDGLRRAEVASRLGVARSTISVMADRSHVRSVERLAGAILDLVAPASR